MPLLRIAFIIILSLTITRPLMAQSKADSAAILKTMMMQADTVASLFINQDFDKFIAKMDPRLLKAMGGEAKMKEALEKVAEELKNNECTFSKATFNNPTAIVMSGNEMQCILHEQVLITTPDTVMASNALMLAMSQDKGKHWTFVDVPKGDLENLRAIFPNINNKLKSEKK